MKIVLWRFAHNCLPTGQKLRIRNIPAYDFYYHCGRDETVEHVFLTCQYVMEIWKELKKRCNFRRLPKPFGSPRQWIFETLANCSDREATIIVISFWHIWEARNTVRNGENEVHPHCIVEKKYLHTWIWCCCICTNLSFPTGVISSSLNIGIHRR